MIELVPRPVRPREHTCRTLCSRLCLRSDRRVDTRSWPSWARRAGQRRPHGQNRRQLRQHQIGPGIKL